MKKKQDPYRELGVSRDATTSEIKSAYKARAKQTHPDAGGAKEEFQRVAAAYALLSDPARRADYDEGRESAQPGRVVTDAVRAVMAEFAARNHRRADIIGYAVERLEFNCRQSLERAKKAREAAAEMRDAAARCVLPDGAENVLSRAFSVEADSADQAAATHEQEAEAARAAAEWLGDYGYRVDPAPEPGHWDDTGLMNLLESPTYARKL